MTNKQNITVKRTRVKLLEKFGNICWEKGCDNKKDLQFAHIVHDRNIPNTARGRKERIYDVRKNPYKFMLLCRRSHEQYDNYEIEVDFNKIPEWWQKIWFDMVDEGIKILPKIFMRFVEG